MGQNRSSISCFLIYNFNHLILIQLTHISSGSRISIKGPTPLTISCFLNYNFNHFILIKLTQNLSVVDYTFLDKDVTVENVWNIVFIFPNCWATSVHIIDLYIHLSFGEGIFKNIFPHILEQSISSLWKGFLQTFPSRLWTYCLGKSFIRIFSFTHWKTVFLP